MIFNDELDRTPLTVRRGARGEEIIAYLYDKENRSNYVIIDDEEFDYETYFRKSSIIKTDIYLGALEQGMVDDWLKNNNLLDSPANE
jgi:hypothetical protein